jgi:hypothetical protein
MTPHLKNKLNQKKAGWGMPQVVQYLPNKFKALSSNPNDPQKKEKEIIEEK